MGNYEIGSEYEIGDEELIGDDEDEIIGDDDLEALLGAVARAKKKTVIRRAPARSAPSRNSQLSQALATRAAQQGTLLRRSSPTKSREYCMGLDSVSVVPANTTTSVSNQPQVIFRPERIIISGAVASSFLVNDFKVGKNSQFASSGALPGDAFAPTAFGVRLKCDTAQVSNQISLNVSNISGGGLRFNAGVFGEAVE